MLLVVSFSPAESSAVAQIGSGVPEARIHEGFTRVPPGFHQFSARDPRGFYEVLRGLRVVRALKRASHAVGLNLFPESMSDAMGSRLVEVIRSLPRWERSRADGSVT